MKLIQNKEHVCKYWETILRRNIRWCKYCKKLQYNYSGNWENEITFNQFVGRYTNAMGKGEIQMQIEIAHAFEANSYESWDTIYYVTMKEGQLAGKRLGYFVNWNQADVEIKKLLK